LFLKQSIQGSKLLRKSRQNFLRMSFCAFSAGRACFYTSCLSLIGQLAAVHARSGDNLDYGLSLFWMDLWDIRGRGWRTSHNELLSWCWLGWYTLLLLKVFVYLLLGLRCKDNSTGDVIVVIWWVVGDCLTKNSLIQISRFYSQL